jgi:hypothetical protein
VVHRGGATARAELDHAIRERVMPATGAHAWEPSIGWND